MSEIDDDDLWSFFDFLFCLLLYVIVWNDEDGDKILVVGADLDSFGSIKSMPAMLIINGLRGSGINTKM